MAKCVGCGKRYAFGVNKKSKGGNGLCNICGKKEACEVKE